MRSSTPGDPVDDLTSVGARAEGLETGSTKTWAECGSGEGEAVVWAGSNLVCESGERDTVVCGSSSGWWEVLVYDGSEGVTACHRLWKQTLTRGE